MIQWFRHGTSSRYSGACRGSGGAAIASGILLLVTQGVAQEIQPVAAPQTVQRPAVEGRRIAEQNFALRRALQALDEANPEPSRITLYVTQRGDDLVWRVYFGSLDFQRRRFMVAYEVIQTAPGSEEFVVATYPEDVPADESVSGAAMALVTALNAFEPPQITFYPHIFRESDGRWVTYFLPDHVQPGGMPQQVNSRVVVSPDTRSVLESTRFYTEISFNIGFDVGTAARREQRTRSEIAKFLRYYVPLAAAQPTVAQLAFLVNLYTCSLTPQQLAPACLR
jgi:hypothetical protein